MVTPDPESDPESEPVPGPDQRLERARSAVATVCDPELPPLTLVDLGIVRSVSVEDGTVVVTVTPTYSGCPALEHIEDEIRRTLTAAGLEPVRVDRSYAPAWTTDWVTERGRRKLADAGISPPRPTAAVAGPSVGMPVALGRRAPSPPCPHCGHTATEELSRFSSTACKALHRCTSCSEPFDHFKEI
ncbi:MAG: 1,2-phenylacetyl-CoA epoxidase subunit PaaD [Acidimicrobiales bacterium]